MISTSFILAFLSIFLLAGCGSSTSAGATSSTTSATAATATACAQATRPASSFKTAVGTLKSINGSTLVVTNRQGNDVTVTYSSTTTFTQESNVAATSLTEGTPVRVAVTNNGGTYTATTITVISGTNGFPRGNGAPGANGTPGAGRRNNPCFSRGQFGGQGTGAGSFRGLTGTVSQVSSTTLTITDTAGTDYIVTITPQTQIVETKSVTAAALKVGQPLTVTGTAGGQGAIAARAVVILLSLPTLTSTPTP